MKIVSWNINGIRAIIEKDFKDSIEKIDADILCLQETRATEELVTKNISATTDKYKIYAASAEKKGYSGVALLSNTEPTKTQAETGIMEQYKEGRILTSEYASFYLVNVYVPNSGQKLERLEYRQQWDRSFLQYLKNLEKEKPVIICGDLNVAHRPIDLKNDKANYNKTAGYTQIEIEGLDNLLDCGYLDSFRHFNPDTVAYTYWSYRFKARERNIGWRIDYFLVSEKLINQVKSVKILSDIYGSDHCPVLLEIDL